MLMETLKSMVKPDAEYRTTFVYNGRRYELLPITGEELIHLVDEETSGGGAVVFFYGSTLAIYHPDGGVTEVALS